MNTSHFKTLLSTKATSAIARLSNPLKNFGINNFIHDITFEKGQISILSNHAEIFEYYYKNQVPAVCTNDQGRILQPGTYLDCKLKRDHRDYSLRFSKVHKLFNIKNFIHVIEIEQDCQHFYSFSFNLDEIDFLHFVINNMAIIKNFIVDYKSQANEIIHQAKLPKNRITLPLYDRNHQENNLFLYENELNKTLPHKNTKEPITLTPQQFKCLSALMEGNSSKEIAMNLSLSPRTVEHYLAHLKKKLGCSHSKDLISTYRMEFLS